MSPIHCRGRAFTLIEVLVVVTIIALLIALLLPSLASARRTAQSAVCASNLKQLATAGTIWMLQNNKSRAPAHRGWVPFLLKQLTGAIGPFACPSDREPTPIPALYVEQFKNGLTFPSASVDGGVFARRNAPRPDGSYDAWFETETESAIAGDADFNDMQLIYKPAGFLSNRGQVTAQLQSTGRTLVLRTWKGRLLGTLNPLRKITVTSEDIIWGSYGMNLSSALRDAKPHQAMYMDHTDWIAVVEKELRIRYIDENDIYSRTILRWDSPAMPERWLEWRHARRANVSFVDTHVESVHPEKMRNRDAQIWHPKRPTGWKPTGYD